MGGADIAMQNCIMKEEIMPLSACEECKCSEQCPLLDRAGWVLPPVRLRVRRPGQAASHLTAMAPEGAG